MPVRLENCLLATVVVVAARAQRGWRGEVEEIWRGWMGPLKGARFPLAADAYHAHPRYRTQNVEACCSRARLILCTTASCLHHVYGEKQSISIQYVHRIGATSRCHLGLQFQDCVVKYESYVVPIWRLHARLPTSPPRRFFCAAFYHDDDQRTTLAPITSTY